MSPIIKRYLAHIEQAKHSAHARFVASGYRDHSARAEFLRLYVLKQQVIRNVR